MINNIIFDLDGTLVDTIKDIIDSFNKAYREIPRFINIRIQKKYLSLPLSQAIMKITPSIQASELRTLKKAFINHYDSSSLSKTELYPGVDDTLKFLKENKRRLFIVTNKRARPTKRILDAFKIDIFDGIITSDSNKGKILTKQQMLSLLIKKRSLLKGTMMMIGDTEYDIAAARSCGIISVAALYGYGKKSNLLKNGPDYTIKRIEDLKGVISRIERRATL